MKFSGLYEKDLNRRVNPAVSASDLSEETVNTEIDEYVFTPEIIANLFIVLSNIRRNQGNHVGIWINGYFGSGKSHFLKYANYCMHKDYAERAFGRLIEAARAQLNGDKDPLALLQANVEVPKLQELQKWYKEKAQVEMVMFNIGEVHNANESESVALTSILWNQFNAMRGFNSINLALAQHLEKALYVDGKHEAFMELVKERGYNWQKNISLFASAKLDMALKMAHEVDSNLSIDVIRRRVANNEINVSVEEFAKEVKEYVDSKGDPNYRVLFFIDEMSQFIGEHTQLLLQLQSLVERLQTACQSKVWIACTAQQTIENVVLKVGGKVDFNDDIGKILGRFEVRASLQGTKPEHITQQRILEKRGEAEIELEKLYEGDREKLDAQFVLPATYEAFKSADEFTKYYPFVPYQFQLIMKVLDNFVNIGYVDKQVRGNERSLLNITHSIARETAEWEVGKLIPFDKFFGPMFQSSMQHLGLRAIENANHAVELIPEGEDRNFSRRVEYVLFMICNLSDADKPGFAATVDNVVTLLMDKIDEDKADTKEKVERVLNYLIDKSVIRMDKTQSGADVYVFYTEEESQVAEMIKNQRVDSNTFAEELNTIISNHFNLSNKEQFATRSFTVGYSVNDRHYLTNNGNVEVDFVTSAQTNSPDEFALNNKQHHLVFFLSHLWNEDEALREKFYNYCQVQCFIQQPATSDEMKRIKERFRERANEMYNREIKLRLREILDTCPIVSGQNVLSEAEINSSSEKNRYKKAIACHLGNVYRFARMVDNAEVPKNLPELKNKIQRPTETNLIETPLSPAEEKMKEYLDNQSHDVTADDVVRHFEDAPFGWSEVASLYILNELVRRHLYAFTYNNNPSVARETVAQYLAKEKSNFTIEKAKAIPQSVLNDFVEAWNHVFNGKKLVGSSDSTELYRLCREAEDSEFNKQYNDYKQLSAKHAERPFVEPIFQAVKLMEEWKTIHDHRKFFETITQAKTEAAKLFDLCKKICEFDKEQYEKYEGILSFLRANHDNFSYLTGQQSAIKSLEGIHSDKTPWEHLHAYRKIKKDLETQLSQYRGQLIENIKTAYNKVFDELEKYATSVHVERDKFANRERTVEEKTKTNNFPALETNANVSSFREAQMKKINESIPPEQKHRTREAITLTTHTTDPIRTESDVDSYLLRLKGEIMKHIGDDKEIVIN